MLENVSCYAIKQQSYAIKCLHICRYLVPPLVFKPVGGYTVTSICDLWPCVSTPVGGTENVFYRSSRHMGECHCGPSCVLSNISSGKS